MENDDFGNRMKSYEFTETSRKADKLLPIVVRLDGRSFSKFTKGMNRPYDMGMTLCMQATTRYLVEQTSAKLGYTQSDEITLLYWNDKPNSDYMFNGKFFKLTSILASMATLKFNQELLFEHPEYRYKNPIFDCRVFQVPNLVEAINAVAWRQQDAIKNSISMAAQSVYSHKDLLGKDSKQKKEMLLDKNIDWNKYPEFFKSGTFYTAVKEIRKYHGFELNDIPPKHEARTNPDLKVERTEIKRLVNVPKLIELNHIERIITLKLN